jgi:hypothetical protein
LIVYVTVKITISLIVYVTVKITISLIVYVTVKITISLIGHNSNLKVINVQTTLGSN